MVIDEGRQGAGSRGAGRRAAMIPPCCEAMVREIAGLVMMIERSRNHNDSFFSRSLSGLRPPKEATT